MGTKRVTPAEKRQFLNLLSEGWTVEQAASQIGRSLSWGKQFIRTIRATQAKHDDVEGGRGNAHNPLTGLSPQEIARELAADESMQGRDLAPLSPQTDEPASPSAASQIFGEQIDSEQGLPPESQDFLLRPLRRSELSPIALECLEDFAKFRYRYFGRMSSPWQEHAAHTTKDRLATPHKEFGVVNAPPGSGKSTLFTHDIPAWLTVRSRSLRGFIGSSTQKMANSYTGRLRSTLDRKIPMQASTEDLAYGLARDADSTLVKDYGLFRPDPSLGAPWTRTQFTVSQLVDTPISEKESTWTAFGEDSGFLGWRVNIAIWDDLVTRDVLRTLEKIEAQRQWWIDEAQTRLEPGGLLLLQGQRLGAEDLYRYCLDMVSGYTELDEHLFELGEEELPDEKKYFHIIYKAHYEEHCRVDEDPSMHRMKAPPYDPNNPTESGCLLEPVRLPWRELKATQEQPLSNYRVVYQQEDVSPDEVLVPKIWLDGGLHSDGIDYPGCYDESRTLGQIPHDLSGLKLSIMTVDPSPTRYWAIQWWLYVEPPNTQRLQGFRYLIDQIRMPLDAPQLLDWVVSLNDYSGILQDWWDRSYKAGHPIRYLIVEKNAAQRFLMQYDWFRRWTMLRSVILRPHETGSNKADPDYGVKTIRNHYRYGRTRLPGAKDAQRTPEGGVAPLVNELTRYPHSSTDDCIMANWFMEYNLQHLVRAETSHPNLYNDMPSWVEGNQSQSAAQAFLSGMTRTMRKVV